MSYFPDNSFDIITLYFSPCKLNNNNEIFIDILSIIRRIINPDGKIYIYGLSQYYSCFLSELELDLLKFNILSIMGKDEFTNFKQYWINNHPKGNWSEDYIFDNLLCYNYKGLYKIDVQNYILKESRKFCTKFLEDIGFSTNLHNRSYSQVSVIKND